ncbi:hypothetical protein EYF80_039144 [Liparis tanakae]|uniref:Uncharacterized protein n=1 Tax=Liparis tanakae TaxID=230148 RepID=A0A4Z2GBP7_9TELE|nr:hypothetical protein EYF80_039144 [Liparis tanakae]
MNCETNEGNGEQMSGEGAGPGRVMGMAWSQVTGTGRKVEVGMWLEVGRPFPAATHAANGLRAFALGSRVLPS